MKVLMMLDGLIFEDLNSEQVTEVLKHSEDVRIKETSKGLKVQGSCDTLYKLLYSLSYKYDIELV